MSVRFSKGAALRYAERRMATLDAEFNRITGRAIDPGDGTSQTLLARWTPLARAGSTLAKEHEAVAIYARWRELDDFVTALREGSVA